MANWKSLFIKEQKEEPVTEAKPEKVVVSQVNHSTAPVQSGTDYNKLLDDAINKADQPGLDYREFANSLAKKNGQPISEQQKYQYTFDAFDASGSTPQALITSASHYDKVIDKEVEEFKAGIESAKQEQIFDKQKWVVEEEKSIAELTKQIQEKSARVEQANVEINTAISSLKIEEDAFNAVVNNRKAIIQEHITKIKTYLNANVTQ